MRAASSLTNRIFLACTLLAMLSLGFAFYFVNERASNEAEAELRRGLVEAGRLVDQHRATRTDHFTRLTRVVADLPKLKAAVETGDPPTVQPLAVEYRTEVNADLLVLTGRTGVVLGSAGNDADIVPATLQNIRSDEEISTFTPHGRGILQLVSIPIVLEGEPPDILGRLTVGFFLDDRLAVELKGLTGSEIAFGADGRILASTLFADAWPALAPSMRASEIGSVSINGAEFLVLALPLRGEATEEVQPQQTGGPPIALILRSRTERLQFLNTIRHLDHGKSNLEVTLFVSFAFMHDGEFTPVMHMPKRICDRRAHGRREEVK